MSSSPHRSQKAANGSLKPSFRLLSGCTGKALGSRFSFSFDTPQPNVAFCFVVHADTDALEKLVELVDDAGMIHSEASSDLPVGWPVVPDFPYFRARWLSVARQGHDTSSFRGEA